MESIQNYVTLARIAEQAERFEDMRKYIDYVATTLPAGATEIHLSPEERNLLSVAYKNIISTRRNAWRSIYSIEQKEMSKNDSSELLAEISGFKKVIEDEMRDICGAVISIITNNLLHDNDPIDDRVYYLKMMGDYYRYQCEFLPLHENSSIVLKADEWYAVFRWVDA